MAEDKQIEKKKDDVDVQSQIQTAIRSRVSHFKQQADSLTYEGVRRLLEKDLAFEEFSLDSHKRFIKQCLEKCLEEAGDDDAPKTSGEEGEKGESTQEMEGQTEEIQSKDEKDVPDDDEKMEDSPVLGLLKEQKKVKQEAKKEEGNGKKVVPNEALIKKAIRKRSSYLKDNAEKVTMGGLRRLLEEDLKLEEFTLDPFKNFIRQQLDEVLSSSEVVEPAKSAKKIVKKKPDSKPTKKVSTEENSDNSDETSEEEEDEEDEVKPRKKSVPKGKTQTPAGPKKRKGDETNLPSKKKAKPDKSASEVNSDAEDDGINSEDDQSHSSAENTTKKKQVAAPVYSKRVEHLKSVIKACGMSVPPVIYKKVKQVPENKREEQLIKELEEILSREGLSSNPSEKEIKEVNRKKARAKELEGIDMSNIVSSTRRRATISFAPPPPPPKPKTPVESSGKDKKVGDDDNDDEGKDNEEVEEGEEGEEDEEDEEEEEEEDSSDDGSESEDFNADEEDSD